MAHHSYRGTWRRRRGHGLGQLCSQQPSEVYTIIFHSLYEGKLRYQEEKDHVQGHATAEGQAQTGTWG